MATSLFRCLLTTPEPASVTLSLHTSHYPGFCSMKRLRIFVLPPGWDASPSQGYPQHGICRYPFLTTGWRVALWEWRALPMNTTQCPRPGLEPGPLDSESSTPPSLPQLQKNILYFNSWIFQSWKIIFLIVASQVFLLIYKWRCCSIELRNKCFVSSRFRGISATQKIN